jgi:hypothetical protein
VKVRSPGIPDCVIVRLFAAPSASVAVAVIVASAVPSAPLAVAGAEIAGCWFVFAIVSTVVVVAVAFPAPVPSLTVHTMLYGLPALSVNPGVPVIVAVRGDTPGV